MACAGLLKTTLIDYPGHIAAIVFIRGCPFRCSFCHNPELVDPLRYAPIIPTEDIVTFLRSRKGQLDGVCITGGEPTTWQGLAEFIEQVHAMGFKIKLDSNGYYPDILTQILESGLIDYVAMDVKGPLDRYASITGIPLDTERIVRSIQLIQRAKKSGLIREYEFRTTLVKPLLDVESAYAIGHMILGADNYFVQNFIASKHVGDTEGFSGFSQAERESFAAIMRTFVSRVIVR